MIDEATVDAYRESEQLGGFYTMIEDHLAVPFETTLLGMPVTVRGVDPHRARRDRRHLRPRAPPAGDSNPRPCAPVTGTRRCRVD
jgi:hypothetical protein